MKTTLLLAALLAAPSLHAATLAPATSGELLIRYTPAFIEFMTDDEDHNTSGEGYGNYKFVDFFDARYDTTSTTAIAESDGFSNYTLQGLQGWDQTHRFSFNFSDDASLRSTVKTTDAFAFSYEEGVLTTSGSIGLSGIIRMHETTKITNPSTGAFGTYLIYGDYRLRPGSGGGNWLLDSHAGFTLNGAFELQVALTTKVGNDIVLSGQLLPGPLMPYFFHGYAEPYGTFELRFTDMEAIPEPSSLVLLGLAAAGFLYRRRRTGPVV